MADMTDQSVQDGESPSKPLIDDANCLHNDKVTNHESSDTSGSSRETVIDAALSSDRGTTPEAEGHPDTTGLLSPPSSGRKRAHSPTSISAGSEDGAASDLLERPLKRRCTKGDDDSDEDDIEDDNALEGRKEHGVDEDGKSPTSWATEDLLTNESE
jgi:hypothetical protein